MRIFWSFIALVMLGTALLYIVPSLAGEREVIPTPEVMNDIPDGVKASSPPVQLDEPTESTPKSEDDPAIEKTSPSISKPEETLDRELEPSKEAIQQVIEDTRDAVLNDAAEDSTTHSQETASPEKIQPTIPEESLNTIVDTANAQDADPEIPEQIEGAEKSKAPEEAETTDPKERFKVLGSGTKDAPYRVTWEMLTSAYESYRPREDKNEIPEWVQMLHDKYVKISGYLAFPMLTGEVDEALVMLNQWDGCCLGVPPSPYDSIEVKLTSTMIAEQGAFTPFGAVEGKLLVDPYLVNGWLVGLYLMEEAFVETVD